MVRQVALVAALLLVLAPASAQAALTISGINAPASPLIPEVEQRPVDIELEVDCSTVWARRPAAGGDSVIHLQFKAMAAVLITGPSSVAVPADACPTTQGKAQVTATVQAAVLRYAPGLTQLPVDVEAYMEGQSLVPNDSAEDEAGFLVFAAPYFQSSLQVPQRIASCACRETTFELRIENLGNVRTQYDFTAVTLGDDVEVLVPDTLVLDSPNSGGGVTNASVTVVARMAHAGEGAFTIEAVPRAADAPDQQGQALAASLLARRTADGLGDAGALDEAANDAPAPTGMLLALGLVALAGLVRRRA